MFSRISLALLTCQMALATPLIATSQNHLDEAAILEAQEIKAAAWLNFTQTPDIVDHLSLRKRQSGCWNQATVVDKTETFIDWDVQMSPIVCAVGPATITVTEGYSTSNSLSVSAGLDFTAIKDKLSQQLSVDFSKTWTTTTMVAVGMTVPDKHCGVMIWKPSTTRKYGSVMEGCVGSMKKTGTWVGNDRGSAKYNGVDWIAGARSLCAKPGTNPPLSLCQGSGDFV